MFTCEDCAIKNKIEIPIYYLPSYGPCEWCGKKRPCYDVRPKPLPNPPEETDG
jgi:hypothetical protein